MGVETNSYDIPELVLGDTFYEWFTLTNNEIINKLNRLEIYSPFSAGGSAGDGISAGTDTNGALHIEVISPIQKDMVFNGNLTVNGNTTTINSTDFTVDDFNIVLGATAGNTANDQEIMDFSGNSAGGGFIIRGSSGDKEFLWKYNNAAFNINQNLDFADQKSISSSGDGVRIATGASGGNATKGLIFGFTAGTGIAGGLTASDTLIRAFNTDIAAGQSADALYVNDDGYVSIVNGANKITVDQTSHGLSFGMPVYMKTADGKYTKALANNAATSEVIGVVSRVYNDNRFELSLSGEIIGDFSQINEGNAALVAGQAYFVDTANAGKITPTKPTNEDFFQKSVLIGLTTDRAIVKNFIGAEVAQEQRAADALVSNKIQISQTAHGFTNGHALYYDGAISQYRVAESQDGLDEVVGIVEKVNSADIFEMVLSGQIRFPEVTGHGCNAMTAGDTHYITPTGTSATFANVIRNTDLVDAGGFGNNDINKPLFVATSQSTAIVTNLRGILFDDTEENNTIDVPVGAIMAFSGTEIPDGYALCDGQYLNIADFTDLHKHFERENFPFADGNEPSGTFKLPDLTDRFIIGKGTNPDSGDRKGSDELGKAGGLAEVTLSAAESGLPEHFHGARRANSSGGSGTGNLGGNDSPDRFNQTTGVRNAAEEEIGAQSAAEAHENRPPYLTLVWIIRTKGVNALLDGTQILGGDVEFQPVGENLTFGQNGLDGDGEFDLISSLVSETDRAFTVFNGTVGPDRIQEVTVRKLDLTDSGVGIFPERLRRCSLRFRSTGSTLTRACVYYKYPDGNFRKCVSVDSPSSDSAVGTTFFQEDFINIPIDSSQTDLEFIIVSGPNHRVELFITGVEQVVDNSLTRLKKSYGSRKNLLLNGNFDFWERQVATGAAADTTSTDFYSADRWKRTSSGDSDMTREVQRGNFNVTTGVPEKLESGNFPKHYIKLKGRSDDLKTAQFAALEQRIEDYRTLNHKNATLSFWANGDVVGNFHVGLQRKNDLGAEPFYNIKDFRIEETGTWKKYTASIVVPEVTFGYNNLEDTYLSLIFHTAVKGGERGYVGTSDINYTGTLSIAQVQLEEGSTPTPFEYLSVAEELPLLQRYYWRDDNLSQNDGAPADRNTLFFPVTMRKVPLTTDVRVGLITLTGSGTPAIETIGKRSLTWASTGTTDQQATGWDVDAEL